MKQKLLLAAVTLFAAVFSGGGNSSAQTDVTASYIGNFDRCSGTNGEPNGHTEADGIGWWNTQNTPGGWHAFVKNGDAIESWSPGIGSAGVMLGRTMVLPAGNYTLSFEAFGCTASNASDKTPSSSGDVVAFMTGKDNVDVTNTTLGGNTFHSVSYTFDVATDNTAYEFGIKKLTNESKAEWCQIKNVKLVLNSTNIFPVPNNSVDGFTYNGTQTWQPNTWSTEGQWDGSRFQVPFLELWRNKNDNKGLDDATISASYTPTQTGVYMVSAWVRAVNENGGSVTGAKIFVGDSEADACAGSSVIDGKGRLGTYTAMADGEANTPFEYGFKLENAAINWLSFKNVTITYLGSLPEEYVNTLLSCVPTGKMNADVKSTLDGYVTELNTTKSVANYNNLSLYLPTAEASVDVYSNINTAISNYAAKAAVLDTDGAAAYDASAIQTKYDNGSYESLAEAESELNDAFVAAVKAQTTVGSDWTGVIVNPSFESELSTGWTSDGIGRQNNTAFGKTGTWYAEAWEPDGTKSVSQTISALPAGVYSLSAKSRARGVTSAKLYAGENEKAITIVDADNTYTVDFACDDNASVTIGFEGVGTKAGSSWLCVDNFTLTLVSAGLPDVTAVTGKMNASVQAAQTAAISAYNTNKTVANYNAAAAAITAAQDSKDAYTKVNAALTKVSNILDGTNLYTAEALDDFNSIVTTAQGKYNEGTMTTEECNEFTVTLFGSGWHSTAAVDDLLISAWDVDPRDWNTYHVNTWSTVADSGNPNFETPCIEYWTGDNNKLGDKVLTATIEGLNPGDTYKVELTACVGLSTSETASTTGITLQLNEGTAVDVCSGAQIGETRFYEDDFTATGIIGLDGNLNVKLNVSSTNVSWLTFRNVKYTKTATAAEATTDEIAALQNAIDAANAKTLGFEEEEYAPYNNVEAIKALAEAENVKANYTTQYAVVTATTALTNATWTPNTTEVNAIYWADYTSNDIASDGYIHPLGWTNTGYNTRIYSDAAGNKETNSGISAVNNLAMMMKYNTTYGENIGYSMPLKAGSIYKLTFKYCGWGNTPTTNVVLTDPNNETITLKPSFRPSSNDGNINAEHWNEYSAYFTSTTEGNYVLAFNKEDQTQQQIGIGDITLYKANSITIDENATYDNTLAGTVDVTLNRTIRKGANTLVLPFSMTQEEVEDNFGEEAKVYVISEYDDATSTIRFAEQKEGIMPNKPCILEATVAGTSYTLAGRTLVASESDPKMTTTDGDFSMIGTYAPIEEIGKNANNYIMYEDDLYFVDSKVSMDGTRAYFHVNGSDNSRVLSVVYEGDEATEIAEIDEEPVEDGVIYNLAGQVVGSDYKGIAIINGKKVLLK